MLDFHADKGFQLLPDIWTSYFAQGGREAVLAFIRAVLGLPIRFVLPLGILSFVTYIRRQIAERKLTPPGRVDFNLWLIQKRYLKPKKVSEIAGLLPIITESLQSRNISHVVDVGSGFGHISRFLANQSPSISVLRLEAQGQLLEKANKIDKMFNGETSKKLNILSTNRLLQLGPGLVKSFMDILIEVDATHSTTFSTSPILLLGLHPCGDLGPYMIKLFSNSPSCRGLVMVSCCYLHCTHQGYPISDHLKSKNHSLSLPIREQTCHNIEVYLQRILAQLSNPKKVLNQHWRSIGEISLRDRTGDKGQRVCFKKARENETVVEFINRNLAFFGYSTLTNEEEHYTESDASESNWETWVYYFFYTFKLCLGVAGEHLILSDRLLYLLERRHKAELLRHKLGD
eukprot:sb/3465344/